MPIGSCFLSPASSSTTSVRRSSIASKKLEAAKRVGGDREKESREGGKRSRSEDERALRASSQTEVGMAKSSGPESPRLRQMRSTSPSTPPIRKLVMVEYAAAGGCGSKWVERRGDSSPAAAVAGS